MLGRLLNIGIADLTRIGTPAPAGAGALYRRQGEAAGPEGDLELLADALAAPRSADEWDEVDELFFGPR